MYFGVKIFTRINSLDSLIISYSKQLLPLPNTSTCHYATLTHHHHYICRPNVDCLMHQVDHVNTYSPVILRVF